MVQEDIPHGAHATVKEVAIHISNHTMRVGDRGVVVIGGSADVGDLGHHGNAGSRGRLCNLAHLLLLSFSSFGMEKELRVCIIYRYPEAKAVLT